MSTGENLERVDIGKIESTSLDQLVQVLEISFIFLLTYSLIALFDEAFVQLELYKPLASDYLGEENIGSLRGGQFEEIVRVTLVFNLLLFAFSLIFGMWMRRTRDGWTFNQLGFTINTPNYSFKDIIERGLILGLLAIVIQYTILTPVVWIKESDFELAIQSVHSFSFEGESFTSQQLPAEYYFGFIEMGFIWPLSAGFFFFAYTHNSLKAKFPTGIANLLATTFYVFYLAFFFMITERGKVDQLINNFDKYLGNIVFWATLVVFFIILYISFSAFAETKSIVLPFLLNFVWNAGLTIFKSLNSLLYDESSPLMLIPYLLSVILLIILFTRRRNSFSNISLGIDHLKHIKLISKRKTIGLSFLFVLFALVTPSILEYTLSIETKTWVIPTVIAILYCVIIGLAIIVLTYEPTEVFDVLLINRDGLPIASHIELFQTDDVLISGFFTALSSVSSEIDAEESELKSIKQGERDILIEDGVLTRVVALADKDQPSIRSAIIQLQKNFEKKNAEEIRSWTGEDIKSAKSLVNDIGALSVRFSIPQQTKWIGTLTMIFSPIFIILIGLMQL
ncbi:MAG: hypothetical protein ACXAD7_14590 [Candidatus Kariarchaeaceae archaeon]|jgi:hypothetical protein